MRSLYISLLSEFYKSRKTLAFWASVLLPAIICTLIALGFSGQNQRMIDLHLTPQLLWFQLIRSTISVMGIMILPFYVIFMAFSVNNVEHKNDTWKTLFAQPLHKFSIYFAKFLYGVILIFICALLFAFLTWVSGHVLQAMHHQFNFKDFSPVSMLRKIYLRAFLASLGIFSIQFILSLIWADFLKPMGIGLIATIMGIILVMAHWQYTYLIPYCAPTAATSFKDLKSTMEGNFVIFTEEVWISLIYTVVFCISGYFIVLKKNIK